MVGAEMMSRGQKLARGLGVMGRVYVRLMFVRLIRCQDIRLVMGVRWGRWFMGLERVRGEGKGRARGGGEVRR